MSYKMAIMQVTYWPIHAINNFCSFYVFIVLEIITDESPFINVAKIRAVTQVEHNSMISHNITLFPGNNMHIHLHSLVTCITHCMGNSVFYSDAHPLQIDY